MPAREGTNAAIADPNLQTNVNRLILFLLVTGGAASAGASPAPAPAGASTFYVSPAGNHSNPGTLSQPFLTVEDARQVIRGSNGNMVEDTIVYLRGGTYTLSSTLNFDQLDSGTNGHDVIYKAYPGESPILSGGQIITNWTAVPATSLYKASVTSSLRFRDFYVNGQRAIRARDPNAGRYYFTRKWNDHDRTIVIPKNQISNKLQNLNQVEIAIQSFGGVDAKLRIASVVPAGGTFWGNWRGETIITPMEPERTHVFAQSPYPPHAGGRPFYFVNAFEFLDSPGEWYLDTVTNTLYYLPRPGENMASAEAVAPNLETLVNIQGTLSEPAHNLVFHGLTFAYTNWTEPSATGYVKDQACINFAQNEPLPADQVTSYPGRRVPAGFVIDSAHDILLQRNVFEHFGATAINLYKAASYNTLIGNVITDTSDSGICVDLNLEGCPGLDGHPGDSRVLSPHNTIKDNYLSKIGQEYYGATGIFVGYTDGSIIEHNTLHDMPSHGIDVGWGWDYGANGAKNNLIRYNRVYHVMNLISDGAGIYTLSQQPGTTIDENYLHDIYHSVTAGYDNNGMMFDSGSSLISASNNVCENIPDGCIRFNTDPNGIALINNSGHSWATKNNAGIEPAYRDIIPGATPTPAPGTPTPGDRGE